MKKIFYVALPLVSVVMFSGCATVQLEPKEVSQKTKQFNLPSDGNSGLYVFRDSIFGAAVKKNIYIDDKFIGESAPITFFYDEIKGDKEHKISTESEFSNNDLIIKTESGKNYFIRHYIKFGAFVAGANLQIVEEEEAKRAISKLEMAKKLN